MINHGINYRSTSHEEVLERRIYLDAAKRMTAMSKFITKPVDPSLAHRDVIEEFAKIRPYFLPKGEPYQSKVVYKVVKNDEWGEDSEDDEAELEEVPQPFETVMEIGYKHNLHHLPTKFFCRRSDILVSSTLSFTLCPMEKTSYVKKNFAEMTDE